MKKMIRSFIGIMCFIGVINSFNACSSNYKEYDEKIVFESQSESNSFYKNIMFMKDMFIIRKNIMEQNEDYAIDKIIEMDNEYESIPFIGEIPSKYFIDIDSDGNYKINSDRVFDYINFYGREVVIKNAEIAACEMVESDSYYCYGNCKINPEDYSESFQSIYDNKYFSGTMCDGYKYTVDAYPDEIMNYITMIYSMKNMDNIDSYNGYSINDYYKEKDNDIYDKCIFTTDEINTMINIIFTTSNNEDTYNNTKIYYKN